jgi:hypothetical protein
MRKKGLAVVLAWALVLAIVVPVTAITGGQPDGNGHPYGALLLVPEVGVCSGTLIGEDTVLTAGHCTDFFGAYGEVWVTFDPEATVDDDWAPDGGTWYLAHAFTTHPGYDGGAWPFTPDYGIVHLDQPVAGIVPALLPTEGLVDDLIGEHGQTDQRFLDVGYGQNGNDVGNGPPRRFFDFVRKYAVQRYHPGQGAVGAWDPSWLVLNNVPSDKHGSGCGGDSGSAILPDSDTPMGDTVLAVHTGGYRLGFNGNICGRITSLNHRIDMPDILPWVASFVD